jgi:hypothetical protein
MNNTETVTSEQVLIAAGFSLSDSPWPVWVSKSGDNAVSLESDGEWELLRFTDGDIDGVAQGRYVTMRNIDLERDELTGNTPEELQAALEAL